MAPPANRDQLPLWHSVYFRNEFNCSYYNTKMIRQGVLTWGQLQSLEDVRLLNALPRTWKGVYNHGGRLLNKVPSQGGFDTPAVHVQNWTRAWLLQFYASQPGVRDPQTPEVWEQWAQAQLPPRVRDFAQKVLWHKLTVHARVYKRLGTDKCLVCSQKETVKHAMVECPMFKAAAAVIQHYHGPVDTGNGKSAVRDTVSSGHTVLQHRSERHQAAVQKAKAQEKQEPRTGSVMTEPVAPAFWCGYLTGFKLNNACMSEICVLTQSFSSQEPRFVAACSSTQKRPQSG